MRLSINSDDPGYAAFRAMRKRALMPVITVDGVRVMRCTTADTKRGIVTFIELDESGKPTLNAKRDAVKLKRMAGQVAITFRPGNAMLRM